MAAEVVKHKGYAKKKFIILDLQTVTYGILSNHLRSNQGLL